MSQGQARRWYSSQRWQYRREQQLAAEPLCHMCLADGIVTAAKVADHDPPHRGDYDKFWSGRLRSLCKMHHDSDAQRRDAGLPEKASFDANGAPIW